MPNRNFWIALAVWGTYWLFAPLLPRPDLFDFLNGLSMACAAGVVVAYAPGAWKGITVPHRETVAGHYLVMGVVAGCIGFSAHRAWGWFWRVTGKPEWMLDHLALGFCFWIMASGHVLHLTSVGAVDGRIPRKNWIRLGACVAGTLTIVALTALFD